MRQAPSPHPDPDGGRHLFSRKTRQFLGRRLPCRAIVGVVGVTYLQIDPEKSAPVRHSKVSSDADNTASGAAARAAGRVAVSRRSRGNLASNVEIVANDGNQAGSESRRSRGPTASSSSRRLSFSTPTGASPECRGISTAIRRFGWDPLSAGAPACSIRLASVVHTSGRHPSVR